MNELLNAVLQASPERQTELLEEMVSMGPEGADQILESLEKYSPDKAAWAFVVLSRMTEVAVEASVARFLGSPRADLRQHAMNVLADRNAQDSVRAIVPLLRDSETDVRAVAANAVGRLGGEDELEALADAAFDAESRVRVQAIPGAVGLALRINEPGTLAERWLERIETLEGERLVEMLGGLALLSTRQNVAEYPMDAVRTAFIERVGDDHEGVRGAAVAGVGDFKPDPAGAAVQALNGRLTEETSPKVLLRICDALGKLGSPAAAPAIPNLIELLLSENAEVKAAAERTLKKVTRQTSLGSDYDAWRAWLEGGGRTR